MKNKYFVFRAQLAASPSSFTLHHVTETAGDQTTDLVTPSDTRAGNGAGDRFDIQFQYPWATDSVDTIINHGAITTASVCGKSVNFSFF